MTYLLDTHVFLWLQTARARIRPALLEELQDGQTSMLLSAVGSWEIAIKWAIGRLPLPEPPGRYIPSRMELSLIHI